MESGGERVLPVRSVPHEIGSDFRRERGRTMHPQNTADTSPTLTFEEEAGGRGGN